MHFRISIVLLGFLLAFAGCSSRNTTQSGKQPEKQAAAKTSAVNSSSDCVRGEPEALLGSHSVFKQAGPHEALETVDTGSPIQLVIHHFGCTHYALDFEFTFPGERMPDPHVSIKDAAALLEKLPFKEGNKQAMKGIVAAMRRMAEDPYKQPLTMSETETLAATTPALNVLRIRYDVAL
ncbi:MAG: hypothetical protein IT165_32870 [Bryobacterales bacterium]|nr:hypothetical protein [Bryobacterales bacterium]